MPSKIIGFNQSGESYAVLVDTDTFAYTVKRVAPDVLEWLVGAGTAEIAARRDDGSAVLFSKGGRSLIADRFGRVSESGDPTVSADEQTSCAAVQDSPGVARDTVAAPGRHSGVITVYHGTDHVLCQPLFGFGGSDNDYGSGFYTTESKELAAEWAVFSPKRADRHDGYVNEYKLDLSGLSVLRLTDADVDAWIAIVMKYRAGAYSALEQDAIDEFVEKRYNGSEMEHDVIIGWRADDSYFKFAYEYARGALRKHVLLAAMKLGELGEQVFIRSELAFSRLTWIAQYPVKADTYYDKAFKRDVDAKAAFEAMIKAGGNR
jgi:hypothetical protein